MELVLASLRSDERASRPETRTAHCRGRPSQCRQVDLGECADRRRARDRVRPAGHDARQHLRRVRARRQALHFDRYGGLAAAGQGQRRPSRSFRSSKRCRPSRMPMSRSSCSMHSRRSRSRTRTSPASFWRPGAHWWWRSTSGTDLSEEQRDQHQARVRAQAGFLELCAAALRVCVGGPRAWPNLSNR